MCLLEITSEKRLPVPGGNYERLSGRFLQMKRLKHKALLKLWGKVLSGSGRREW
jgi:hypothetical protein